MKTKFFVSKNMKEFSVNEKAKPDFIELEIFPLFLLKNGNFSNLKKKRKYMRDTLLRLSIREFEYNQGTGKYAIEWGDDTVLAKYGNYYCIEKKE